MLICTSTRMIRCCWKQLNHSHKSQNFDNESSLRNSFHFTGLPMFFSPKISVIGLANVRDNNPLYLPLAFQLMGYYCVESASHRWTTASIIKSSIHHTVWTRQLSILVERVKIKVKIIRAQYRMMAKPSLTYGVERGSWYWGHAFG